MKTIVILAFFIALSGCTGHFGQFKNASDYFEPKGVVDRTKELVSLSSGWTKLEDLMSVDGYTRIGDLIFGGEIACNIEPLENLDVESFEVLPGTKYARDVKHVYYPLGVPCVEYVDCGVCFYSEILIKGANPETFTYLGSDYAADGENAYFRGQKLGQADGLTFKVILGPEFFYFAIDKNNVYRHSTIFSEADPETFYYKSPEEYEGYEINGAMLVGDKNYEWQFIPPATLTRTKTK